MFYYKLKFLFPKKLSINPNQNSTKPTKERDDFVMGNLKTQYHNTLKKKPSTLIKGIRKNKNLERERLLIVFSWEKYGLNERNDIEFIQKQK